MVYTVLTPKTEKIAQSLIALVINVKITLRTVFIV